MAQSDAGVWFITGSTSGFGRALVDTARARGSRVVATARRPEALAEPALDAAVDRFERIDVLVNNAGMGYVGALEEMNLADLRSVMETMFFGPAALTRAVVPRMRAQGSGAR